MQTGKKRFSLLKGAFIAWAVSALIGSLLVFSAGVMAAIDSGVIDPSETARVLDIAMRAVGAGPEAASWRSIAIMSLAFSWIFRDGLRRLVDILLDLLKDGLDGLKTLIGALIDHDDDEDQERPAEQTPPDRPAPPPADAERVANIQRFERGEQPNAEV
jgi:hypothetical protein